MTTYDNATIHTLGDRGQTIDGSANDVRGRAVTDETGADIGTVADLLVDDREEKVRFLVVAHGGFLGLGQTKTLLPVDAITKITAHEVLINHSREQVTTAPGYAPHLVDDRPYHSSIYNHYGSAPYWGQSYVYPTGLFPISVLRAPSPG